MDAQNLLVQIQEAIDQAEPGQHIAIPEGKLEGTLVVHKPVRLVGQGIGKTFLDGQTQQVALIVEADEGQVLVENLCIQNGASPEGGGLQVFNGAHVKLSNCLLQNNEAIEGPGGGIAVPDGQVEANNCQFNNNRAQHGGAAFCGEVSTASFADCTFTGNTAQSGGALWLIEQVKVTAENCTFEDNQASQGGSHLHLQGTTSVAPEVTLIGCTFYASKKGQDFFNHPEHPAKVALEETPLKEFQLRHLFP